MGGGAVWYGRGGEEGDGGGGSKVVVDADSCELLLIKVEPGKTIPHQEFIDAATKWAAVGRGAGGGGCSGGFG